MARSRKIKRRTQLYKKNRVNKKVANAVLFILVVAVLVVFGYILGSEWFKKSKGNGDNNNSSSPATSAPTDSSDVSSDKTSSENTSSKDAPQTSEYKMAFMPYTAYEGKSEAQIRQWIKTAKANGFNTVAVELKDEVGIIHYNSNNAMAIEYGAISKNPIELSTLTNAILAEGMSSQAVISTLKDKTAPSVARENSYAYDNQLTVNWWDDSATKGGKPWLNPYMQNTRTYIKDLCKEIADGGFSQVLLTNVMFPDKNTGKMNVITETMSREDILKKVVVEATNDEAFASFGYYLGQGEDAEQKILNAINNYEGSAPFILQADFDALKPLLDKHEIDDYVIY